MITQQVDPLSRLVLELSKLPGIGEKTATRLAHFILNQEQIYAENLARAIIEAKIKLKFCHECFQFSENDLCLICSDVRRDHTTICVVEQPSDIQALERSGNYRGVYHVLHGVISPLDGIGPDTIKAKELFKRLKDDVREVIFALNPTVESEATILYLSRLIQPSGLKVTQVAYGLPMGGAIEFSDRHTLSKAMENRTEVHAR